jgi:hypothetical protein
MLSFFMSQLLLLSRFDLAYPVARFAGLTGSARSSPEQSAEVRP